jgi:hypothetical protein
MSERGLDPPDLSGGQRPYLRVGIRVAMVAVIVGVWAVLVVRGWLGVGWAVAFGLAILGVAALNWFYVSGLWDGDYDAEEFPAGPVEPP